MMNAENVAMSNEKEKEKIVTHLHEPVESRPTDARYNQEPCVYCYNCEKCVRRRVDTSK